MSRFERLRRLAADPSGATIVEFAMVAPIMCALLVGVLDLGYRTYVTSIVQGSLHEAARMATVGNVSTATIEAHVRARLHEFSRDATIETSTQSYSDFTGVSVPEPITQDTAPTGSYNPARLLLGHQRQRRLRYRPRPRRHGRRRGRGQIPGADGLSAVVPGGRLLRREQQCRDRKKHGASQPAVRWAKHPNPGDGMLKIRKTLTRVRALAARLRSDDGGLAFIEFAMSLPVLVTFAFCGLEAANFAMAHLRVANIAMLTADNASRVRDSIDEANVIELLTGAKMSGDSIQFRQNGRIILSSIENTDTDNDGNNGHGNNPGGCDPSNPGHGSTCGNQWVRWQRCDGARNATSVYGTQGNTNLTRVGTGTNAFTVQPGTAVMVVEVNIIISR